MTAVKLEATQRISHTLSVTHIQPFGTDPSRDAAAVDRIWRFIAAIQAALDPRELTEALSAELGSFVHHDGVRFLNLARGLDIRVGTTRRHRCAFRLCLDQRFLGELTVFRARRFSDREVRALESLVTLVHHSFRNALLYREAEVGSRIDPLTGIGNRAAMETALVRELRSAYRQGGNLAIAMLDIDHFKTINDTYGHLAGDLVLKRLADLMTRATRRTDLLFRFGGDEFLTILVNVEEPGARTLLERLLARVEATRVEHGGAQISLTMSAGIVGCGGEIDPKALMTRADQALYRAKASGRNRVDVWMPASRHPGP